MHDPVPHIVPGRRDVVALERLREAGSVSEPPLVEPDYGGRVVQKPWGFEFLAFETAETATWRLRINPGHSTSMHCHPRKRTALLVLAGQAMCHTFGGRFPLGVYDIIVLAAGVFHSTKAMSAAGLDLLEVETPRCKNDLARLHDLYGRAGAAYEGLSEIHTERLERFEHFSLGDAAADVDGRHLDARQRFRLAVRYFDAPALRGWGLQPSARALVVLSGAIDDSRGRHLAGIGDALRPAAVAGCEVGGPAPLLALALDDPAGGDAVEGRVIVSAHRKRGFPA